MPDADTLPVTVRKMPRDLWAAARSKACLEQRSMTEVLTTLVREWVDTDTKEDQ